MRSFEKKNPQEIGHRSTIEIRKLLVRWCDFVYAFASRLKSIEDSRWPGSSIRHGWLDVLRGIICFSTSGTICTSCHSHTYMHTRTHLSRSQFYTLNNRSTLIYESSVLPRVQSIMMYYINYWLRQFFFLVLASTRKSLSTNFNIKCMPVAKLLNIYTNALVFVSQW